MDSDCLVKLTKSGAKEVILSGMEVHIPPLVKMETVDEAKMHGYEDAFTIDRNIEKKAIQVVALKRERAPDMSVRGEAEVVALYLEGNYDAIASDDRRFLKRLDADNIPFLTPTACLVHLHKSGKIGKAQALEMLEALKSFVSTDEYAVAKLYLEEKS